MTGIGQSLDALQRRAIEALPVSSCRSPGGRGHRSCASCMAPDGRGWRQLRQPVKDYWQQAGVPQAQKDFADDVVSGLGQMLGQMG